MRKLILVLIALAFMGVGISPAASQSGSSVPGEMASLTPNELRITRFYKAVLDREPDTKGMAYWYSLLSTGADPVQIADAFARSAEFKERFGVAEGPSGDMRFLEQVYLNVLGRNPDAAGRRYWNDLLQAGVPRSHIVLWFSESAEFSQQTGLQAAKLPPFRSNVSRVTQADLGVSWRTGCPVAPKDLRLLTMSYVNFGGTESMGEIVVHADSAADILVVFERLYIARYPIQSMRTINEFGGSDDASMEANNTSAFNCRNAVFRTTWSEHAYGRALDVNPLVNPYVKNSVVLPEAGRKFADRSIHNPALIRDGDAVVEAFDSIGWAWGGRWSTVKDYQHFSLQNR